MSKEVPKCILQITTKNVICKFERMGYCLNPNKCKDKGYLMGGLK